MNRSKVFIGLGSNVGDKQTNIETAINKINEDNNCEVIERSSIYETKPFGEIEQSNFLNAVISIQTDYLPHELFSFLIIIESEIGRKKTERWGPRQIDLDILFYNDLVLKTKDLKIPHDGITERDFVLIPLNEIAPNYFHPELNEKISDICDRITAKTIIRKYSFTASVK